jgi:cyclohexanecarboxylate-CoA ligase
MGSDGHRDPADAATLTEGIRAGVAAWPDARITFSGERGDSSCSIGDLHEAGRRVAGGLSRLGLAAGDVLAMQMPNSPEAVITCLAAAELGLTLVPVVHVFGEAESSFILTASRASAIVVHDRWRGTNFADRIQSGRRPPSLGHVIVVGEARSDRRMQEIRWTTLIASDVPSRVHQPAAGDIALLLYTSGTTGVPKGVVPTQGTLAAELAQMLAFNAGEDGDVTLVSFPIGHMAGVLGATRAFYRDRHTIFMEAWDPAAAARLVAEYGVTSSAGTPFHLLSLFEAADRDHRSLDSIRTFLLGATNVSPVLVAAADRRGIRAFRCYGSTEQPTVSCGKPSDSFADRTTTDGQVLPGVEVRIVDDDEVDLPLGQAGEILSRGPDLSPAYTDAALDHAARTTDGWYRSGDIGTIDGRGFLTITDRKKDLIIRGVENIASKEIEDVLGSSPGVREVVVIGVPDDRYGERVCAVVVGDGGSIDLGALRAHVLAAGLARHKAPESMVVVDDLPRTASGKVQKHVLRDAIRAVGRPRR